MSGVACSAVLEAILSVAATALLCSLATILGVLQAQLLAHPALKGMLCFLVAVMLGDCTPSNGILEARRVV